LYYYIVSVCVNPAFNWLQYEMKKCSERRKHCALAV